MDFIESELTKGQHIPTLSVKLTVFAGKTALSFVSF